MNNLPYVGITGITEVGQSEAILRFARDLGWPRERLIMLGVLASYKGLVWGQPANPKQYVDIARLDEVVVDDERAFNLVHYNSRAQGLSTQLEDLLGLATAITGVQLNVAWPNASQLRRLRTRMYLKVVLQIGAEAWGMIGRDGGRLVEGLRQYAGLVDYVLIDPSGGLGRAFDPDFAAEVLVTLAGADLGMKLGIAGGLEPGKLEVLKPLLAIYPDLSWDAQGRLRDENDELDLGRCQDYLTESYELPI